MIAQAWLSRAIDTLTQAGVPSPQADAEWLAAHLAGCGRFAVRTLPVAPIGFDRAVARRAAREPLQYIIGTAAFRYLDLVVGPGVFIPRPETESLVDLVLTKPWRTAVDLGAGSGAIGLSLVTETTDTQVVLVEREAAARTWLQRNVDAQPPEVQRRLAVLAGDFSQPLEQWWRPLDGPSLPPLGTVDVVACNPPYVPRSVEVEPEVRCDPETAVYGDGDQALDQVIAAAECALRLLRPGGRFVLEHDASHQPAAIAALRACGLVDVRGLRDLAGRPRCITARRPGDC